MTLQNCHGASHLWLSNKYLADQSLNVSARLDVVVKMKKSEVLGLGLILTLLSGKQTISLFLNKRGRGIKGFPMGAIGMWSTPVLYTKILFANSKIRFTI